MVRTFSSKSALYITVQTAAATIVTPEMKNISIPPFSSPKTPSRVLKGMNQYTSTSTPMKVYATRSEVSGRT